MAVSYAGCEPFSLPFSAPAKMYTFLHDDGYRQGLNGGSSGNMFWTRAAPADRAGSHLDDAARLQSRFTAIVGVLTEASPQFCGLALQLLAEYTL